MPGYCSEALQRFRHGVTFKKQDQPHQHSIPIYGEMLAAYLKLTGRLAAAGIEPKMHVLDYECSAEFKKAIIKNGMKYQLVPPNDHRRNVAEKAIQVFKDHYISVLCGTDVSFPTRLWCRLLRQAEDQLSMLRTSRVGIQVCHTKEETTDFDKIHFDTLGFSRRAIMSTQACFETWIRFGFCLVLERSCSRGGGATA